MAFLFNLNRKKEKAAKNWHFFLTVLKLKGLEGENEEEQQQQSGETDPPPVEVVEDDVVDDDDKEALETVSERAASLPRTPRQQSGGRLKFNTLPRGFLSQQKKKSNDGKTFLHF